MPVDVIVKGYKFSELSDEAKETAKEVTGWDEFHRERCVEHMKEDACAWLNTLTSWDLNYSIGFCQGDGVGFTGQIDATEIEDPEWVKKVLPLLGAHKAKRTVGKHTVEWPDPIKQLTIRFEQGSGRHYPGFLDSDVVIDVEFATDPLEGEWPDDEELEINAHWYDHAPEIWFAVTEYFEELSRRLYRECADAMLEGDDEGMELDCEERDLIFDERGHLL